MSNALASHVSASSTDVMPNLDDPLSAGSVSQDPPTESYGHAGGARPAKRARMSAGGGEPKAQRKRKRGLLSMLPSLPLDILFEIFGFLPPGDLLQLARVSKAFRQLLMTRARASLWRASYMHVPECPKCPADFSEPAWAHLLFGGAYCHLCGAKPVRVHFNLMRRVCKACLSKHLLTREECQDRAPRYIDTFLDHMTSTLESKLESRRHLAVYWWDEDVDAVNYRLERIFKDYDDGDIIEELLLDMLEELTSASCARLKLARECEKWQRAIDDARYEELKSGQDNRRKEIFKRLSAIGFETVDVRCLYNHREVKAEQPLTDRVWKRVKPILVEELAQVKAGRLSREKSARCEDRKRSVNTVYDNFLKTIPPTQWSISPSQLEIHSFPAFQAFIEEDREDPQFPLDQFPALKTSLMAHIEDCARRRHATILATRRASIFTTAATGPSEALVEEGLPLVCNHLKSATCVYQAVPGGMYFGSEALEHAQERWPPSHPQVEFHSPGSSAVYLLLSFLGLDPVTTTPADLDTLDPAFVCMACPIVRLRSQPHIRGRLVRSWREYAVHYKEHADGHTPPSWQRLTDAEATSCGFKDRARFSEDGWICQHCIYYHGRIGKDLPAGRHWTWQPHHRWGKHTEVVAHLKEVHDISEPTDGEDLTQYARIRDQARADACLIFLSETPNSASEPAQAQSSAAPENSSTSATTVQAEPPQGTAA